MQQRGEPANSASNQNQNLLLGVQPGGAGGHNSCPVTASIAAAARPQASSAYTVSSETPGSQLKGFLLFFFSPSAALGCAAAGARAAGRSS